MRLLMLTPRFPYPPMRGDSVRAWGHLRLLASRHDVWLASLDDHPPGEEALAHVRSLCRDVAVAWRPAWRSLARGVSALLGGRCLTQGYFHDAALHAAIQRWTNRVDFDAVLTFSFGMSPYAAGVDAARRVLDANDVDSYKWRVFSRRSRPPLSWLYATEGRRLSVAERRWAARHDVAVFVNERERLRFQRSGAPTPAVVLPTAVPAERVAARAPLPRDPVVGILGSMSYAPNARGVIWFVEKVWPRVREACPLAEFRIIGRAPSRAVRRLGRRAGVVVTGAAPDASAALAGLRVFVAPVTEEIGVQTKLIEAMAAGRPAVVTPQTAAGIDSHGPAPFLVASGGDSFASGVVRLLRDEELSQAYADAGARTVLKQYELGAQLGRLEELLAPRDAARSVA